MKTFSSLKEEIKPKYELKESLKNDIYSIIENTLSIKISNEDSLDKDIAINGKEELVEKIKTLIDEQKLKERVLTLEHVKANVHRNFDMKWLTEQIDLYSGDKKKVKIVNCSSDRYWYKDLVGEIFDVVRDEKRNKWSVVSKDNLSREEVLKKYELYPPAGVVVNSGLLFNDEDVEVIE